MKKYCTLLLALLLLCFAAPLALATELYDTYGNMDNWDDATWELSESWTDEQWQDYWLGEEEAYIREREAQLRVERQSLGLPNPDGVNVKLNESFLTFANAWPYEEDGSVYLPLRDFLAACGVQAQISYNAETGIAHAELADGRELIATLGGDELLIITADGEEDVLYTYDAPLMINGSFYVEHWDLCYLLGLDSRWDYYSEILYIVDSEALIAQIDSNFTNYNRLFSMANVMPDPGQAYQLSGSFAFNGALYGDKTDDTVQAVLEYDGLLRGNDADISFTVKMDFDQIKDTLLSFMDEEDKLLLKAISAAQGRAILNSTQQTVYVQSNLLPLADMRIGSKDWLKLESASYAEDITALSNMMMAEFAGMSIGRMIYDNTYYSYYYYDSRDVYANALNEAKLWQALIGDDNFRQESRSGYTVYTLKTDQAKLKKALADSNVSWPGSGIFGSLFGYYGYFDGEETADISHTLSFREKDGRITDLQAAAEVKTGGYLPVNYGVTLEYDDNHMQARFEMTGRYGGKLSLDAQYQLIPAAKIPATEPPAGSRIITERELSSQRLLW